MDMFLSEPPPLLPVFDAAAIWSDADLTDIEAARVKLRTSFPQFRPHVWSVMLPPGTSLPVFGFWLLNTCLHHDGETEQERSWAVLLLINAATSESAVIPGYSAENWLSNEDWKKVVSSMSPMWKAGNPGPAVIDFFENMESFLIHSWNLRSQRRGNRSKS